MFLIIALVCFPWVKFHVEGSWRRGRQPLQDVLHAAASHAKQSVSTDRHQRPRDMKALKITTHQHPASSPAKGAAKARQLAEREADCDALELAIDRRTELRKKRAAERLGGGTGGEASAADKEIVAALEAVDEEGRRELDKRRKRWVGH